MKRANRTPSASDAARALAAMRKTFAGGRPRSDSPRCPCGAMTAKRAAARGKSSEHLASCPYHKERAA